MSRFKVAQVGSTGPFFVYEEGSRIAVRPSHRDRDRSPVMVRHSMSELYDTTREAQDVADWLNERASGYANLIKFEHGRNWPRKTTSCSVCDGASGPHRQYDVES